MDFDLPRDLPPLPDFGPVAVAAEYAAPRPAGATASPPLVQPPHATPGSIERRQLDGDPGLGYFIYVPSSGGVGARILASVHGISRNAREHAKMFAPLAERADVVVVSPLFERERFPAYQRLGRNERGERPDDVLDQIVADASRVSGACADRVYLFGYSGGGQFVHRYVFAHPERVAAYAIGAAGWYTFPDPGRRFPYGIGRGRKAAVGELVPRRFLDVPGCVLVGERDIHRGSALRNTARVVLEQGHSRVERGQRWAETMNREAQLLGLAPPIAFATLPRSPHSFRRSMRRGGMGERVFEYLFGELSAPAPATAALRTAPCAPPGVSC